MVSNKFGWHIKILNAANSILYSYIYIIRFYIISIFTNYKSKCGFKPTIHSGRDSPSQFCDEFHGTDSSRFGEPFNPFFRRPKAVLEVMDDRSRKNGQESISILGRETTLSFDDSKELWINVRNAGRTPIKRMRARIKMVTLQPLSPIEHIPPKPENVSEAQWTHIQFERQQTRAIMEQQLVENRFGKPLPFSKTPKGTVPLPWAQLDGTTTYEVDLPPNSDDASVRLVGIYDTGMHGGEQLRQQGIIGGSGHPSVKQYIIGGIGETLINSSNNNGKLMYNLAVKFWVTADNLPKEISEIYHIEIPSNSNTILWKKYEKKTKEYKELYKKLSL